MGQRLQAKGYSTHGIGKYDIGMAGESSWPLGSHRTFTRIRARLRGHIRTPTFALAHIHPPSAVPELAPAMRGFDTYTGFYQHAGDYWKKKGTIPATGELDECGNTQTDFFTVNATYSGVVPETEVWADCCDNAAGTSCAPDFCGGCEHELCNGIPKDPYPIEYREVFFLNQALKAIANHDLSRPFFLYHAFGLVHTPLQASGRDCAEIVCRSGE